MSKHRALYLEWEDASSFDNSWRSEDEMKRGSGPCVIRTVGFVAKEDDRCITMVGSIDSKTGAMTGDMTIPKSAIRKRRRVSMKP